MLERKKLLESLTDEQRDELLRKEKQEAVGQMRRGDPEAFEGIMAASGGLIRKGFRGGDAARSDAASGRDAGRASPSGGVDDRGSNEQNLNQQGIVAAAKIRNAQPQKSPFQTFLDHSLFTKGLKRVGSIPNYHQLGGFDFMSRFPNTPPSVAKALGYGYQGLTEFGKSLIDPDYSLEEAYDKAKEEGRLNAVGIDDFFDPNSLTAQQYFNLPSDLQPNFAVGGRVGFGGGSDMGTVADSQGNVGPGAGGYQGGGTEGPDDRSTAAQTASHNAAVAAAQAANTVEEKMNILNTLNRFRSNTFFNPYNYSVGLNKNIGPFGLNVGINTLGILGIDDPRTPEDESEQPDYGINAGYNTDLFGGNLSLGAGYNPMSGANLGLSFSKQFNQGGRVGFADGPEDPSKRKFMKIMGGLASLPILGKFIKPAAKVAPAVMEAAKGMPDWFSGLVSKIIETGTDITQQFAKQKGEQVFVKQLGEAEGVRVTKNLETGSVRVDYDSPTNMGEQSVSFTYRPGTRTEKGENIPAQFEAVEAEPRGIRSGPDDYDLEFDGENIVEDANELMSDTSSLKQFATGKLDDADLKLRQQKVKKVEAINNDQVEQAEYLETKYGAGDPDAYKQFPDDDL
jgi:hypothetical protein